MFRSITKQLRRVREVVASVQAVAVNAAAVLDPRLQSFVVEGETLGSIATFQLALARWLGADQDELQRLEQAHRDTLRELARRRQRRDGDQQTLYSRMLRIRKTFEDAFGVGTAPTFLGLDPGMGAVEPIVLLRYAREAVEVLSDPELETPPVLVQGLWQNPLQYAQEIREALTPFEAAVDSVDEQKKVVEKALKAKVDLQEELKARLRWSTQLFEAIFHLAGLGFHAERLRRPEGSRSNGDSPSDGEPAPDEPGDGAPAEETSPDDAPDGGAQGGETKGASAVPA